MREVAEVMLEPASKRGGEFVPYEGECLFEETDSILDGRRFLMRAHTLSRSDNDFLNLIGP